MNECRFIKDNLIDILEDRTSSIVKESIRKHLKECSQCQKLYHKFQAIYDAAGEKEKIRISPTFYARLQSRIDTEPNGQITLEEIWGYLTGKARPIFASLALMAAIIAGHFIGRSAEKYFEINADSSYLSEYYGIDQFELSSPSAVPEIYLQQLEGADNNE